MADAEDNDRAKLVVLKEFWEAIADDSAETRLAVLEKLAEDDPRLTGPKNPVGADSVMYAIFEAFVKVTT